MTSGLQQSIGVISFYDLLFLVMCMPGCLYMSMHAVAKGGQKRVVDSLELKLQAVMNCLMLFWELNSCPVQEWNAADCLARPAGLNCGVILSSTLWTNTESKLSPSVMVDLDYPLNRRLESHKEGVLVGVSVGCRLNCIHRNGKRWHHSLNLGPRLIGTKWRKWAEHR